MLMLDNDSFNKQVKILYYSKMPQVAQAFFEGGFKDTSIASALLLPVAAVKCWRELYKEGALLKNAESDKSAFPFDQTLGKVSWTDFPYDIKRVAKAFFEMGLRCRAISFYLDVPISTVYFWFGLFKKNQFEVEEPQIIKPYEPSGEKIIPLQNERRRYTNEFREVAKECFLKGMSSRETANYLGVSYVTIYRWKRQFVEGSFCVNEKEKKLLTRERQSSQSVPALIDRKAVKELFDVGATDKEIAAAMNVSIETVQAWYRLYKKGEFNDNTGLGIRIAEYSRKSASGFYTKEVRQAAKDYFDRGYGYRLTAKCLGVPVSTVKEWKRLDIEGRFII